MVPISAELLSGREVVRVEVTGSGRSVHHHVVFHWSLNPQTHSLVLQQGKKVMDYG